MAKHTHQLNMTQLLEYVYTDRDAWKTYARYMSLVLEYNSASQFRVKLNGITKYEGNDASIAVFTYNELL